MRFRRVLGLLAAFAACSEATDQLFDPPIVTPVEVAHGLTRLTFSPGPDVALGFSRDGTRVLYRSRGLAGLGNEWRVLSLPVAGGVVREEAALYRKAVRDSLVTLVPRANDRLLVVATPSVGGGIVTCRGCPRGPGVWRLAFWQLRPVDGAALSSIPVRSVTGAGTPRGIAVSGSAYIRITVADSESSQTGADPWGPAVTDTGTYAYYSDGAIVFRFPVDSPEVVGDSITPGAFPAVSSDGRTLAWSRPTGLDSTMSFCSSGTCSQTKVYWHATGWMSFVGDSSGAVRDSVAGAEPRFDPTGTRLVIRRPEGLVIVRLADMSETLVPGTAGGYAAVWSPDGGKIAYTTGGTSNADVYLRDVGR